MKNKIKITTILSALFTVAILAAVTLGVVNTSVDSTKKDHHKVSAAKYADLFSSKSINRKEMTHFKLDFDSEKIHLIDLFTKFYESSNKDDLIFDELKIKKNINQFCHSIITKNSEFINKLLYINTKYQVIDNKLDLDVRWINRNSFLNNIDDVIYYDKKTIEIKTKNII